MLALRYHRWAPAVALIAGLVGCAGQQTSAGGPIPQTSGPAFSRFAAKAAEPDALHPNQRKSWIKPEATTSSLVYISDTFPKVVNVYTFPGLKYVGQLTGFVYPLGECADKLGNVWITDAGGAVYEYAHGGTNPIVTLLSDMDHPSGCAVDPRTGDLAIANGNAQVLVFHTGSSSPTVYTDSNFSQTSFLSYDNRDNLFVDGTDSNNMFHYAELPRGSQTLTDISLNYNSFPMLQTPGDIKWDGTNIVISDTQWTLYRTQGASVVNTITLTTTCAFAFDIVKSRRAGLVAPDQCSPDKLVGTYAYPAGGSPIKVVTSGLTTPYGAAFSR